MYPLPRPTEAEEIAWLLTTNAMLEFDHEQKSKGGIEPAEETPDG